jgi:hypothetical protein
MFPMWNPRLGSRKDGIKNLLQYMSLVIKKREDMSLSKHCFQVGIGYQHVTFLYAKWLFDHSYCHGCVPLWVSKPTA